MASEMSVSHWRAGARPGADREVAPEAAWYAVWTRSHCEQLVRDQLAAMSFRPFLPTLETWSRRNGSRHRIHLPMFPGYLFVHHALDKYSYVDILKARGVVGLLGGNWSQLWPIPDEEIEAVSRAADSGLPVVVHPYLSNGNRVRIVGGPLQGLEGFFVRSKPNLGLVVLCVHLLKRSVAVEVDCTLVERV